LVFGGMVFHRVVAPGVSRGRCGGQTQMGEVRVVGIRVEQPQNQPVLRPLRLRLSNKASNHPDR
jgi:hypothetical protein